MSDRPSHNLAGLDIDLARRIDAICRRFEADWRDRQQPRLEDYLDDVPGDVRPALRTELAALEARVGPVGGAHAGPRGRLDHRSGAPDRIASHRRRADLGSRGCWHFPTPGGRDGRHSRGRHLAAAP